jgi:transposase
MRMLFVALWVAGAVQIAIALANFVLPAKLQYRENLERVAPIIRQIFLVHFGYIVGIVLLFAALTFRFAAELASGHGLGRFLAASMAVFWLSRVPLQMFYYDAGVRRANRLGDAAMTLALVFLAATYAAAALVRVS